MCGEKLRHEDCERSRLGSPPRVRGKASAARRCRCPQGITPACAGKSPSTRQSSAHGRDHPRVCGEKFLLPVGQLEKIGSPPRVRGKALQQCPCHNVFQDHPRVCGEKLMFGVPLAAIYGSPPRVRGKACAVSLFPFPEGITPACAGKSRRSSIVPPRTRDHPRVCGEK